MRAGPAAVGPLLSSGDTGGHLRPDVETAIGHDDVGHEVERDGVRVDDVEAHPDGAPGAQSPVHVAITYLLRLAPPHGRGPVAGSDRRDGAALAVVDGESE